MSAATAGLVAVLGFAGCGEDEQQGRGDFATIDQEAKIKQISTIPGEDAPVAIDPDTISGPQKKKKPKTTPKPKPKPLTGTQLRTRALSATRSALGAFGMSGSNVKVSSRGGEVIVSVPRSAACKATAADRDKMLNRIARKAPSVKSLKLRVGERALAGYIKDRCGPPKLPSAPGRVVYQRSGEGFFDTPEFTVGTSRWRVEYRNDARTLQVIPYRGDRALTPFAIARRPSGGFQSYSGTGKFMLKIAGSGRWVVRVREQG